MALANGIAGAVLVAVVSQSKQHPVADQAQAPTGRRHRNAHVHGADVEIRRDLGVGG